MEGTVTCFDATVNEVIDIQHIGMREVWTCDAHRVANSRPTNTVQDRTGSLEQIAPRENDPRTVDYIGASTTYESFGVECISKRLKNRGLVVWN
jgi:hypothetical protein